MACGQAATVMARGALPTTATGWADSSVQDLDDGVDDDPTSAIMSVAS